MNTTNIKIESCPPLKEPIISPSKKFIKLVFSKVKPALVYNMIASGKKEHGFWNKIKILCINRKESGYNLNAAG